MVCHNPIHLPTSQLEADQSPRQGKCIPQELVESVQNIETGYRVSNNSNLEQKMTPDSYVVLEHPFYITEESEGLKTIGTDHDEEQTYARCIDTTKQGLC